MDITVTLILLSHWKLWDIYEKLIMKPKSTNIIFNILQKYNISKNICEQNLNIFFNTYSVKILWVTNSKLKIYQILSLKIQKTKTIIFKVYLKLYDLFTSLFLASL